MCFHATLVSLLSLQASVGCDGSLLWVSCWQAGSLPRVHRNIDSDRERKSGIVDYGRGSFEIEGT